LWRPLEAGDAFGVAHRDIEPSNLMGLFGPTRPPIVKILDLGIPRTQGTLVP
jgi:serine/threonine protein kinase